ncbi:major facilitator superfamily domain-containing protein [Mycena albidolilacea]|uniref:Major facilitator superfamily domain-containing protein n=1 Tax=Mycena albidolilacea TaxID=1033008 RepID=A0AAD6ZXA1_9AGAR|nr:major facilitator superfamily domain-containing protein [Mycena albidolilacea]
MDAEKPGKEARFENLRDNSEGRPIHKTETNTTGTDAEKGSTSYAASTTGLDHKIETSRAERRLLFKLDIVILPLAVLLYLSAYLDRGNLGNARLQGLQATVLRGSDTNYSLALSCFYITYILLSVPGTLLAKAILPSTAISIGALIWSIAATSQAATFSPAALYVSRLFVGVGESLFGQSMGLYLTYWYLPDELSKRIGLFISAGSVAGAFGGLISYGVSSITHPRMTQWRILFLIEGIPSFVLAFIVFFCLPSRPQTSSYLSEDERTLALTRLNTRHVGKGLGLGEGHTGVDWKAVKRALLDWKTYVVSVIYSCMNLCLGSVTGFLPTIVKGLGYSDANAQLFTVPPYVVALVFMLLMSTYSDAHQTRGIPVAIVFGIAIVGWSILLAVPAVAPTYSDLHARYFGCICIVTAGYANIPLIISWQTGNTASQSQRAASLGMLNAVGQCLSVLAAFLFPSEEGPKFVKGTSTNIAFSALGFILTLFMTAYYRHENARRNQNELGIPEHMEGEDAEEVGKYDLARGFRYTP